jgi:glycosyltransferase involved in cell wall biosynthesis
MARREKIAVIGTNGIPARYGGFETLAHHLTLHLGSDFDFIVYCSKAPKKQRLKSYNNAKLYYFPFRANGWQSVIFDITTIIHAWFVADKLLILGSSGALIFPFKFLSGKKLILNIGGIDWGRSKWSYPVKKFIQLSEWLCVRFSDIVITDNAYIQQLYKLYYNVESKLIEYGGDHVKHVKINDETLLKYPFLRDRYILSISRAQNDNNIHMLLESFENLPEFHLVIISNWSFSNYGNKLNRKYKNKFENISIVDAIYDQTELDIIRSNAWLYIHSHSFCGTAPSLVEAMNLRLPIICYDAKTNIETTGNKSIYFNNKEQLSFILKTLDNEKIENLKNHLYEIALRRYKWSIIADKYKQCINI